MANTCDNSGKSKYFKVTLTYQFEFKKEIYDASIWILYKATDLCGGCEARRMGQPKLQDLAQELKQTGHNIVAIKDIITHEIFI
jgi:hypothetical protein